MKLVTIEAFFPELKGGNINKTGRGKGSSWPVAMHRAAQDLHRQTKGRSIHTFKATVTIIDAVEDNKDGTPKG